MTKNSKAIWGGVLVLCLAAAAFLLHWGITAPGFLAPRIERRLGSYLQAEVQVEKVRFGIFSGAHLETVTIAPKGGKGEKPPPQPFSLRDVRVEHAVVPLLAGRYQPEQIRIKALEAQITPAFLRWLRGLDGRVQKKPAPPAVTVSGGLLHIKRPAWPHPVTLREIAFSAEPAGDRRVLGASSFHIGKNFFTFRYNADMEKSRASVRVSGRLEDLAALPVSDPGNREFPLADAQVRAGVSGKLDFSFPRTAGTWPELSGELQLSGLCARHPAFETALENGFADFRITENAVILQGGRAEVAGGCLEIPIAGAGFQQGGFGSAWIRWDARDLDLSLLAASPLARAVPAKLRANSLSGSINGHGHLQWTSAEGAAYGGRLEIADAAGTLASPSASFSDLDASMRLASPGRLFLSQAVFRIFGGHAEARGTCRFSEGKISSPDLEVQFTGLTDSAAVTAKLPRPVQEFIRKAGLRSPSLQGRAALGREGLKLDVSVDAKAAEMPEFPIILDDPHLEIQWEKGSRRVIFANGRAKLAGSPLQATGQMTIGSPPDLDFALVGRYLPLNRRLLQWLGLDMKRLDVTGTFDLEMRARDWWPSGKGPEGFLKQVRAMVDVRDAALHHSEAGKIGEHIYGRVNLDKEGMYFSGVSGEFFGVGLRGGGHLGLGQKSRDTYFHVVSENINLDDRLYKRLPWGPAAKDLGLSGRCSLRAEVRDAGNGGEAVAADISALLHHLELTPQGKKMTASGSARIRVSAKDWSNPEIRGSADLGQLRFENLDADRLTADFRFHEHSLVIDEMTLGAYGGKLQLRDAVLNSRTWLWSTRAEISHIDLESLLAAFGIEGRQAPTGVMRGELRMSGRKTEGRALEGDGTIKASRGRLYNLPLLVAVFNVLDLQLPRHSPITDAYGSFRITGGRLKVRDLLFSGGTAPVYMQGSIDLAAEGPLKQSPLELIVTVAKEEGVLDQIPLINWAKRYTLDYLRRLVFQTRVAGTLGDYEVITVSNPITEPVRKMFSLLEKLAQKPNPGR